MTANRPDGDRRGEGGFTLLEVVCVLAIFAMVAATVTLALPRGTSRARLESYAIATAALLKADRDAAVRRGIQVATQVDAGTRLISSGVTERVVQIPDDVEFDALLAARCVQQSTRSTIRFFASGMSCGGAIALKRLGFGYEVRVNWLTGRVEVVAINPA
jgi:general secretion pathway protein H